jgi:hypothetical protein
MITDCAIRTSTIYGVHTDGWYDDAAMALARLKLAKKAYPNADVHIVERMLNAWMIPPEDLAERSTAGAQYGVSL